MATQRLTIATIAGRSAITIAARFERWRSLNNPEEVDWLCSTLRENALSLSIVYFTEWVDRWLMGDQVPGPGKVDGHQFQATALRPEQALQWANQLKGQFAEQSWLACRLREGAGGWPDMAEPYLVVIIREPIGPSTTDDEIRVAAGTVAPWLTPT